MRRWLWVDIWLRKALFHYGLFVFRFRYAILVLSFALALTLAPGIPLFLPGNTLNDFNYIFAPQDGLHSKVRPASPSLHVQEVQWEGLLGVG